MSCCLQGTHATIRYIVCVPQNDSPPRPRMGEAVDDPGLESLTESTILKEEW